MIARIRKSKSETASEDEGSRGLCGSGVQAAGQAASEDKSEHKEQITHQNHFQEAREDEEIFLSAILETTVSL